MLADFRDFKHKISKTSLPIYLIHGEENFLIQETRTQLAQWLATRGFSETSLFHVENNHFDWSELEADAQALSLFGDKKRVDLRITLSKVNKTISQSLLKYVKTLADAGEDTALVISLGKLDKEEKSSAWFDFVANKGLSIACDKLEKRFVQDWIVDRFARQHQFFEKNQNGRQALELLVSETEGNLLATAQEIEKIGLLFPEGEIKLGQLEYALANLKGARYTVFKLSEAVFAGQVKRVHQILQILNDEFDHLILVLWILNEDLKTLILLKSSRQNQRSPVDILRQQRVWGEKARIFERLHTVVTPAELDAWILGLQACEGIAKGIPHKQWINEPYLAIHNFCMQVSLSIRRKRSR